MDRQRRHDDQLDQLRRNTSRYGSTVRGAAYLQESPERVALLRRRTNRSEVADLFHWFVDIRQVQRLRPSQGRGECVQRLCILKRYFFIVFLVSLL